jgi:hypothetical protein
MTADLPELDARTMGEVMDRVTSPDYLRWDATVRRLGGCRHPVRLVGRLVDEGTGEVVYDTRREPDERLLKGCGNRRASVCPSCAWVYRGDTWQMLHAGMVGGKGLPESVAEHPAVFVTLTAPSFGAVHGVRDGRRPCRAGGVGKVCRHGQPRGCGRRHREGDAGLGEPLCPECYDYNGHVLFNWWAPELWRRFTIAFGRHLARRLGISDTVRRRHLRISFAKVAEFQRRGVVHFHALIRLDGRQVSVHRYRDAAGRLRSKVIEHYETAEGPDGPTERPVLCPPAWTVTAEDLAAAARSAAAHVTYTADEDPDHAVSLRFGEQVDVRPVNSGLPGELTGRTVAAYISKYATKAAEDLGLGPEDQPTSWHVRRIIATGRHLAAAVPELGELMGRWERMLFFRGHFSTKSRRYSTTLGALRRARAVFQRRADRIARGLDPDEFDDTTLVLGTWTYAGQGYATDGDAMLAASIEAWTRESREHARHAA